MKIEELSVKNFKGLKYINLEPKRINLITGRNNTGKTSLLQSIDLLFNPDNIKNYKKNYTKLIRENYNKCELSGEVKDSQANLKLEKIDKEDIWEDYVITFIERYIKRIKNLYDRDLDHKNDLPINWADIEEPIRESLETQLEKVSPSDILMTPIILTKDDDEYPFVLSKIRRFIDNDKIIDDTLNKLEGEPEDQKRIANIILRGRPIPIHSTSPGFIEEIPEKTKKVNFIQELNPRKLAKDEEERVAVKEDDIEDHIKEKGLVENLKSFNLNQLVFKKNNEKYEVPYEFMGDGFKTIVGILWHLLEGDYEGEVCLIEEPENHMHPGYTKQLVYFLIDISQEYNIQFFITTHDRDFIESFFGDNIKEKERDYLKDNFLVINMRRDHFQDFEYEKAEYHIEELLKDLRGI